MASAAESPNGETCSRGAGGEPGISHAKAQPELFLEGTPSSVCGCLLSLGASLWVGARALIWCRKLEPCYNCHHPAMSSVTTAPPQKLLLLSQRQRDSKQWKLIQSRVRLCEQRRGKKIQTKEQFRCWAFRQLLSRNTYCWAFNFFFVWPSVDNKLLDVNKDTVLNPFNGDSSLSRSKYHANQFLAD